MLTGDVLVLECASLQMSQPSLVQLQLRKDIMIEIKEGPDLDRAVAEAIGLAPALQSPDGKKFFYDPRDPLHGLRTFLPSTDLNDAFRAAEKTGLFDGTKDGPEVHLAKTIDGQWEVLIGGSEMGYLTREKTPALAICAAILKMKEISELKAPDSHAEVRKIIKEEFAEARREHWENWVLASFHQMENKMLHRLEKLLDKH